MPFWKTYLAQVLLTVILSEFVFSCLMILGPAFRAGTATVSPEFPVVVVTAIVGLAVFAEFGAILLAAWAVRPWKDGR